PNGYTLTDRNLSSLNGSAFIETIGVGTHYRGKAKNGRTLGEHLLTDALEAIQESPDSGPWVLAHVHEGNEACERLLHRADFAKLSGPLWGHQNAA
ncbi:MAG TPA: hypothetical protein VGG08_00545, partial [Solirubrobacteraceae bacterium]